MKRLGGRGGTAAVAVLFFLLISSFAFVALNQPPGVALLSRLGFGSREVVKPTQAPEELRRLSLRAVIYDGPLRKDFEDLALAGSSQTAGVKIEEAFLGPNSTLPRHYRVKAASREILQNEVLSKFRDTSDGVIRIEESQYCPQDQDDSGKDPPCESQFEARLLGPELGISNEHIALVRVRNDDYDPSRYVMNLRLTSEGAKLFEAITEKYVGRELAILVGDDVASCPLVDSPIRGGDVHISPGGRGGAVEQLEQLSKLAQQLKARELGNYARASGLLGWQIVFSLIAALAASLLTLFVRNSRWTRDVWGRAS